MDTDRERGVLVVGTGPVPRCLLWQIRDLGSRLERQRELAVPTGDRLAARSDTQPPQNLTPRPPLVAGAGRDERFEHVLLDSRAACQIPELTVRLLCDDRQCL